MMHPFISRIIKRVRRASCEPSVGTSSQKTIQETLQSKPTISGAAFKNAEKMEGYLKQDQQSQHRNLICGTAVREALVCLIYRDLLHQPLTFSCLRRFCNNYRVESWVHQRYLQLNCPSCRRQSFSPAQDDPLVDTFSETYLESHSKEASQILKLCPAHTDHSPARYT